MRSLYIVSYDVCDPKRLRRVSQALRGYGDRVQLSVFRCELNSRELVELRSKLLELIHESEDQVLFANVGPVEGRGDRSISAIGKSYMRPERNAAVF